MDSKKTVHEVSPELRKKVILKLAQRLGVVAGQYEDIPEHWKNFFAHVKYMTLVRPLLTIDREENKLTYGQLQNKYKVTTRQLHYHFNNFQLIKLQDEDQTTGDG